MVVAKQTKKQVLIDGTTLNRNAKGVGRYTYHICRELDERLTSEWEMTIVTFANPMPPFSKEFRGNFIQLPYKTELELGLHFFPKLIRQLQPTVFIRPYEAIGINYGLPTATVCHDLNEIIWQYQPRRPLLRRLFDASCQMLRAYALRNSALVICNSEFVRNVASKRYHISKDKTQVGFCGVDERFYQIAPTIPVEQIRNRYGSQGYLLAFATGDYRENFVMLPALFEKLRHQGYTDSLVIAGVCEEAAYARILFNDFTVRGLLRDRDYFIEPFLGEDQFYELVALYTAADFYLELSWHEGFGMQLAEAMACGTTCISSGRAALQEVGGQWVIEVDTNCLQQITQSIMEAWTKKIHKRNNNKQIEYSKRFNWKQVGNILEDFLKDY